jgi:hypothetical protein
LLRGWGDSAITISEVAMANAAGESIRKNLAIYAHFIRPQRCGLLKVIGGRLVLI